MTDRDRRVVSSDAHSTGPENYAGTVSATRAGTPEPTDPAPSDDAVTTVELAVGGMHCGACVALIEETLTERSGVRGASVDLEAARALVHFDPSMVGADDLMATVAEAGYSATLVG